MDRRSLLRTLGLPAGAALLSVTLRGPADKAVASPLKACHPENPLAALKAGNARFIALEQRLRTIKDSARRQQVLADHVLDNCHLGAMVLKEGQAPWAGIVTCADSRVPPEWVFDTSPGDLFVVRSAGNTAFDDAVASMEYAVSALGMKLIVVMGHSGCGAVSAAIEQDPLTPLLTQLVQPIRAAIPQGLQDLPQAIRRNAEAAADTMVSKSALLASAVAAGDLQISSAVFDIASSRVTFL
ncbi:MAG: carbonic anhydrase [Aphanocapsa feldmannii 277cV]|uniref:Carbonic anhydrase n=2 Tax=Aphanocapsa feldmannii TaxID=192050 RepID=A0A524RLB9_9CHRO|nr:MAG: carbonic anhydrase [Aphanocapsa feldmannii 288cV]TGG90869.1 MAG: carbonic anhydrase [Aphanocapsa feldmannii 277cV]TGH27081.1 MAG: carbonic anhydrase [Aphanocapsa feldmannii 277cI]